MKIFPYKQDIDYKYSIASKAICSFCKTKDIKYRLVDKEEEGYLEFSSYVFCSKACFVAWKLIDYNNNIESHIRYIYENKKSKRFQ